MAPPEAEKEGSDEDAEERPAIAAAAHIPAPNPPDPLAPGQQAGDPNIANHQVGQPVLHPVPAQPAIMAERATSTIPIDKFKSATDDFEEWIQLFEQAVVLATNAPAARQPALFRSWLGLSLDPAAKDVYRQIPANATYAEAKDLLKKLLIDPTEEYKWQALKNKITWDEKENFHSLASRVKRAVDRYEKYLDADGKKRSYFFRFREALPKPFRDAIDLGLVEEDMRTIEQAILLSSRVQLTRADSEVTFAAAAMTENRVHGLEMQVAELGTKIDNLCLKNSDDKKDQKDRKERGSGRDRRYDRNPSPRWVSSSSGGSRSASRDRDRRGGDRRGGDRRGGDRRGGDRRDGDRRDGDRRDGDRRDRGKDRDDRRDRDKRGNDRRSGRDDRRSGRGRDDRRSSPSTSRSQSRDRDRDRKNKGKDDKRSEKSDHRSLKAEDESSGDEVDEGVLNACIEALQNRKSEQKGKHSKARGNE